MEGACFLKCPFKKVSYQINLIFTQKGCDEARGLIGVEGLPLLLTPGLLAGFSLRALSTHHYLDNKGWLIAWAIAGRPQLSPRNLGEKERDNEKSWGNLVFRESFSFLFTFIPLCPEYYFGLRPSYLSILLEFANDLNLETFTMRACTYL